MSTQAHLKTPPPETPDFLRLSYPSPHVLLIQMDRPSALNALSTTALIEMDAVFRWLDSEPTLVVAVLTGSGRAFCAGADLKEWQQALAVPGRKPFDGGIKFTPLSRRLGKKPIIAAVNGFAFGGGCEFAINCDLVVAADTAVFGLPEVKRGLAPNGGVLGRLVHSAGMQVASEMVLTGRPISAQEMHRWGLVNKVVPSASVVNEAVEYARMIAENSPDGVICARAGLREAWETANVETATDVWLDKHFSKLEKGYNAKEGLAAFVEKRKPKWKEAKL